MSLSRLDNVGWMRLLASAGLFLAALSAHALTPMNERELAEVEGTGLAVGFNNFDFRMAPTSFIELTGAEPSSSADAAGWDRGDVRYYGLSFTGSGSGTDWYDNSCTNPDGLCPLGQGTIANFAPVNNPYVFRAFDNPGYNPSGNLLDGASTPTNLELVGPTASDAWRWAFWGEIEVDRNANDGGPHLLQSQTVIKGRNIVPGPDDSFAGSAGATDDNKASILRVFQTRGTTPTFGFTYQSALSGDFRFTLAQTGTPNSPDTLHQVPNFHEQEGLVFKNVEAFIPLGRLHSQFFSLDNPQGDTTGDFVIELSEVPSAPNAYNDIYCGNQGTACSSSVDQNSKDYFSTVGDNPENVVVKIDNPNPETHGYIRWGDFSGSLYGVGGSGTANGIFFRDPAGNVNNIGVARLEGVLIQSLRVETLGIN